MARTILEIYDSLVDEKENRTELNALAPNPDSSQTFLDDLNSTSKVAIWRLQYFVLAVGIWGLEKIFDLHKADVEARGAELITGSLLWLQQLALAFQLGDTLSFIDDKLQYPVIDETKQIVTRAAAIEVKGQVILKVAKDDVSGDPEPLSAAELAAFNDYVNDAKFAGQNIIVVSRDPDELRITYKVFYDPQILAPDGSLLTDSGTFPAEDAINNYIKNLPFNGVFNVNEQTDALQAVSGIVDPVFQSAEARFGTQPFAAFTENYVAEAGHMIIDPGTPLNTTLTYVANTL